MSLAYLGALLGGCAAMCLLDRRLGLYLWASPRRALAVQAAGVGVLLAWDIVCIRLGIFRRGAGPWTTGVELLPHLPLEEPIFLWFLCHNAMVVFTGASLLLDVRRRRRARAVGEEAAP